jgi:outer membrane protein OmpA-like peptidoglycan-associated protein
MLGVDAAEVLYPMQFQVGTTLSYTDSPLVWRYADGSYDPVINRQVILDIVATAGVWDLVDVALALPIAIDQAGPSDAGFGELSGAGLGDLRLIPRVYLVHERSFGFGVAIIPELTLPTGDSERFLGEDALAFRPRAVATLPIRLAGLPLQAVGSLGYHLRRNAVADTIELGDEIEVRVGAQARLDTDLLPLKIMLELDGATPARRPFAGGGLSALELLGGVRARVTDDFVVTLGAGAGLTRALGTPTYSMIAGLAWAPLPPDADGDGIPDGADECPALPEDYDAFADIDGCPDEDNDRDGIPDAKDECPNVREDFNGNADDDGCPDTGVGDQDGDGFPDDTDDCPAEAEDFDGFEDDDGCPDEDHDHDGILDLEDDCPDQRETINGIDDEDGCPDEGEGDTIYLEDIRIDITARILFESGKATLKAESKPILNQVALQIKAHPEIPRIRVEGHTDSVGNEEDNLFLSQDRADSVRRYLASRGVKREKLEAVGYGESRPIDTNATKAGRASNRRVEFVILKAE